MSTKNEAAKSYVKNWGELPSEFHAYELEMIYQTGWESALANAPEVKELVEACHNFIEHYYVKDSQSLEAKQLIRLVAAFDARGKSE